VLPVRRRFHRPPALRRAAGLQRAGVTVFRAGPARVKLPGRRAARALVEWSAWGRLDNTYILHSSSRNQMQRAAGYADACADRFIETLAVTVDRDAARASRESAAA
jgi:hypothetical protein